MDRNLTLGHQRQSRGGRVFIDWSLDACEVAGTIRAAADSLEPSRAVGFINGIPVQVASATSGGIRSAYAAGTLIRCDDEVWVQAGTGHVVIRQVIDAGGSAVDAAQFFMEYGIAAGHCFDLPPADVRKVAAA